MSGTKSSKSRGVSRRTILAGAGAVALGSGAGLGALAPHQGLRWDEGEPAFEATRRVHVGAGVPGPVQVRLQVETPRGIHAVAEHLVAPGESAEFILEYPFQEVVAGGYRYRVEAEDAKGRVLRCETVDVTLREYRFGC